MVAAEPPAQTSDTDDLLAADRRMLGRTGMVERVTDVLRTRISEGYFPPGSRLSEKQIGDSLGVSRNTLREAFGRLTHDGLVEHKLNRGVFVRSLDADDVVNLYGFRALIECGTVRTITEPPVGLDRVERAVAEGRAAEKERRWQDLGTANIHFHQALVALARNPLVEDSLQSIFAKLRLVFHVMTDPREFHEPYLVRNEEILALLRAGDGAKAERVLADYLADAEAQLVAAYAKRNAVDPAHN